MKTTKHALFILLVAVLSIFGLTTCSIYGMAGDKVADYSQEYLIPHLMSTDDLEMSCATGASMGGVLTSFSRVTDSPDKIASATMLTAGICAELNAREYELESLRALKEGRGGSAQDARIAEKRAHATAAKRYYKGAQHMIAAFGEMGGDKCPKFEDEDELIYLLGIFSAIQAVLHDRSADGAVGVPLDVPSKVARATHCLDNEKWWGVPKALEAAVWTSVPGTAPDGADPWKQHREASKIGEQKGVRLAHAIEAISAAGVGKTDVLRQVITDHANAIKDKPADAKWKLLDETATGYIWFMSDRLWTEAMGHRTPAGSLGTFWDAVQEKADDDLFGE